MKPFCRPNLDSIDGREFDFLVIGAGITGAGVAQDAASRGFSVLLIDKGDFASGTSSKSTKLIHGGLRYLANMQISVTLESLSERKLQQKLAPHMVWAVPFVIPCYQGNFLKNLKLRLGLIAYDLLAGFSNKFRHRSISAAEVLSFCPGVKRQGLKGGLLYYDCRTDDARHTLEVVLSAVQHGAQAVNYLSMHKGLMEDGQLTGALLKDELSGRVLRVKAKQVINATGVWTEATSRAASSSFNGELLPSKGIHICVSKKDLPLEAAMIIPSVHDSRFLFAVPWYDQIVIGTTDSNYSASLDKPLVEAAEERYILDAVNHSFPNAHLSSKNVLGRFAGLRPLVKKAGVKKTADLSRKHSLEVSTQGLISISGGKLTTYRLMAKETVDLAQARLLADESRFLVVGHRVLRVPRVTGRVRRLKPCSTAELRLGGYEAADNVDELNELFFKRALSLGLSLETAKYLPSAYGKRTEQLLQFVEEKLELAERLADGYPYILAQVLYSLRFEAAQSLDDVLARRLRLAIINFNAARKAAEKASFVLASEFGWNAQERERKLLAFCQELE